MAKNKKLEIKTPRGVVVQTTGANGKTRLQLKWNPGFGTKMTGQLNRAQMFLDSEILRRSTPYIPFRTGMLIQSGIMGTDVGSGEVKWIAPYAARQYYTTATTRGYDALRGGKWFERMKIDHGRQIIARAKKIAGGGR